MAEDGHIEIGTGGEVSPNPVIRLWPDGPPSSLPGVGSETTFSISAFGGRETTMLRNVSDPSLTVFAPDPADGSGVRLDGRAATAANQTPWVSDHHHWIRALSLPLKPNQTVGPDQTAPDHA